MNSDEIEALFGHRPGPVLVQLVALAKKIAPGEPEAAFSDLWFYLSWLREGVTPDSMRYDLTPKHYLPFASSGGDGKHFCFVMDDRDVDLDQRTVAYLAPSDDVDFSESVAPNLADFLSVVATVTGEEAKIDRDGDMEVIWDDEDGYTGPNATAQADQLCTLPGVARLKSDDEVDAMIDQTSNEGIVEEWDDVQL